MLKASNESGDPDFSVLVFWTFIKKSEENAHTDY